MKEQTPTRRWYRFSLRTLFVIFTLIAIPLGWVGYTLNWIRQRRVIIPTVASKQEERPDGTLPEPPWELKKFGEIGYSYLWLTNPTPEYLDRVRRLFPEAVVWELRPYEEQAATP